MDNLWIYLAIAHFCLGFGMSFGWYVGNEELTKKTNPTMLDIILTGFILGIGWGPAIMIYGFVAVRSQVNERIKKKQILNRKSSN